MADKQEWITVNGACVPLDKNGDLQGTVGRKIEKDTDVSEKKKQIKNALQEIADGKEEVTLNKLRNDLEQYGGTNDITLIKGNKKEGIILARGFIELGFSICATEGTYRILRENNIEATHILKVSEGRPNIIDSMTNNQISLAINTSDHHSHKEDTHLIRTQIIKNSIPYFTTLSAARVAIEAIKEMQNSNMNEAYALQDYLQN